MRTFDPGIRDELRAAFSAAARRLNREGGADRAPGVVEVEKTLRAFLGQIIEADLEIEFQPPTVETVLSAPRIYIDDGFKGSIEGKGHGLQRAVIFSILRSYAKLVTARGNVEKRTLILGVEEPELYMHPTAQRTVRAVLRTISDGGDQVLFSTHSPLLVDVAYFDEIIRVEAAAGQTEPKPSGAQVFQLPMQRLIDDLVARHPNAHPTPESIRERYSHAYTTTRNEGFFAKQVVLVEGQTETYSLPIYARAMGFEADTMGLTFIECGGKDQIDRLYRIFNELHVPCYVLFDYDKNTTNKGTRDATKRLLEFLGGDTVVPEVPFVSERFAFFATNWERDLSKEILDFNNLGAEATKALGECGKPLISRFIAHRLTAQPEPFIPKTVSEVMRNAVKVRWERSCLKSKAMAAGTPV